MSILVKLFKGEYSLGKSYWLFGNVIPAILFLVIFAVILLESEDPINKIINQDFAPESLLTSIIVLVLSILTLIYILISVVGIWRSAGKYSGKKIWPILAKVTILIGVLLNIKSIIRFF